MNKKILALLLLFAIVLASALVILKDSGKALVCFDDGVCVKAEIADTPEQRAKGLMNRERLDGDEGMLFIFPDEGIQPFWMKNTLIPLDMIWINSSMQVVHIEHAVPCVKDPCAIYDPGIKAKYVVEATSNYTQLNGIQTGDSANIQFSLDSLINKIIGKS
ncbi:MAG: DUF192 domain-containing protein [Candidatus Altiarchaeota archaeon]|nr:DUF192 domain-containing protein [Candidatus Altiarchaeota archaeon]